MTTKLFDIDTKAITLRAVTVTVVGIFTLILAGLAPVAALPAGALLLGLLWTPFRYTEVVDRFKEVKVSLHGVGACVAIAALSTIGIAVWIGTALQGEPAAASELRVVTSGSGYYLLVVTSALALGFFLGQIFELFISHATARLGEKADASAQRCTYITIALTLLLLLIGLALPFVAGGG